jgi:cell division protein FtsZ
LQKNNFCIGMTQLKEEAGIMMFEFAEEIERLADIKVAGVGGAGGNAVGRMIEAGLTGVEFLAVNTDLQALKDSPAHNSMQIGAQLTKGLGSGGDPSRGRAAAEEDRERIAAALNGADMVFVTAGMGGGTGTGAAPVIADIARNQGALTVGIVTKPFAFEGVVRMRQANEGIEALRDSVDTLIIIPNQRLLEVVPPNTSMQEAFRIADNVLYEATRGIYEIISRHDHVNLDFADVRSVMKGMGEAMMGTGRAEGGNRAQEAARAAISSPLLENVDIAGSKAVLVNVLGKEVGLEDTASAMQYIQDAAGPEAHVIFGYGNDESMGDTLQVTVIATGFNSEAAPRAAARVEPVVQASLPVDDPVPVEEVLAAPVQESVAPIAHDEAEEDPEAAEDRINELAEDLDAAMAAAREDAASEWVESEPVTPRDAYQADLTLEPAGATAPPARPVFTPETATKPETGFLSRAAAGGGPDVVASADASAREAARARPGSAHADQPVHQPFLRPVGTRNIGEVEVPEAPAPMVTRSVAAGIGPENPGDDLNAPAYTRKYMD